MEQGDVALLSAIRESLSDSFGPCANPTAIGNKVVIGAASILRELPLPLPLAITLLCRSADCLNNQTSDGCTLASLFTLLLMFVSLL